jgi:hypothetical protein
MNDEQPSMNIKMFPHQLTSIYRMEQLEQTKCIETEDSTTTVKIGINGDIPGYGKTFSILGLILRDKMEWDIYTPYILEKTNVLADGLIVSRTFERYLNKLSTTLILVSASILSQWVKSIKKIGTLTVATVTTRKEIDNLAVELYDIVLVVPSMYNNLISSYGGYVWKRFVFDEPTHTRVTGMKNVNAGFYWLITANPEDITKFYKKTGNNMIARIFWGIIDRDGYYDELVYNPTSFRCKYKDIIIRNDPEYIKESFKMPETIYVTYSCRDPIISAIIGIANSSVIGLLECGDVRGAIMLMGGQHTDNIVDLVKRRKMEELELIKAKINIYIIRNDQDRLISLRTKEKTLLEEVEHLEHKFREMLQGECSICYETIKNHVMEVNCQNIFCGNCITTWLSKHNTCPLCRMNVNTNDLVCIDHDKTKTELGSKYGKLMSKTDQIVNIIENAKDGKILIFSKFEGSFVAIREKLTDSNIKFLMLEGGSKKRANILETYKNGNINVLFLTSESDSAGINLEETTDLILYHSLYKTTKDQIIARAKRIGSRSKLTVHELIVE